MVKFFMLWIDDNLYGEHPKGDCNKGSIIITHPIAAS